jgi:hypothetical protein
MRKFIISLVIFGVLFFVFDKLFYVFIEVSPDKEVDKRLELLINGKINKDIIIVGSSRGARNLIASQLASQINLSVYNLSYPGSNVEFHEFLVRTLVKFNKKPKIIILSVDYPIELTTDPILNFRLDRLYPLVKYDYIMDELVARGEKNKFLSKFFVLHRMSKSNFDIRQKLFTDLDTILPCGSMPISFQKEGMNWKNDVGKNEKYDIKKELTTKINSFKSIISICKKEGIKLVMVSPPLYNKPLNDFKKRLFEVGGSDINLYEYDNNNAVYLDKAYYYDDTHLNKKGAKVFTDEVALVIKSALNN